MGPEINVDFGKKPKKKFPVIWAVIITVVVTAGAAAGAYYYWSKKVAGEKKSMQSQIDTLTAEVTALKKAAEDSAKKAAEEASSGLQTYTNTKYGYEFQYPKGYGLIDYLYDSQTGTKVDQYKIVVVDKNTLPENYLKYATEMPNAYFAVTVTDEAYSKETVESNAGGDAVKDVTIDGVTGWKVVGSTPSVLDESYSTHIYVNHGGYGFDIWWTNSDASGTHDTAIDNIVKSFEWL